MAVKVIAVWGSPGSGKRTVSLALACELNKRRKNALVINTDISVPALPVFLPSLKTTPNNSIGALLSAPVIDYSSLKEKIQVHPQMERVGFMGLCSGETPLTYKAFERNKLIEMIRTIDKLPIDYLIISCVSNPVIDQLTMLALEVSDKVIRLITPDIKGIEFERSHLQWLRNSLNFDVGKHIRIASPTHEKSACDEVAALCGGFDFTLPYSDEVYCEFSAGRKLGECRYNTGIDFDETIEKLFERIDTADDTGDNS